MPQRQFLETRFFPLGMGQMFLLICVSHKMLCARHHVWPETRTMLGTSLCLLSPCCPLRVRNCKDVQGQVGTSCCPLWPCHSQTALIHFWPVCLSTASSTHGHSFKRAVHLLLHLLLFPTIPRDIHYFCATLQLQSILSDSRASGFHTLSYPGRTTMPMELTVGEMGWDESTPKAKMSHAQVVLNNIKDYLSLINACLIVVCP